MGYWLFPDISLRLADAGFFFFTNSRPPATIRVDNKRWRTRYAQLDRNVQYRVSPHTHPKVERITVLAGTFDAGTGYKLNAKEMKPMTAGTYGYWPAGMKHSFPPRRGDFALPRVGPWTIKYVNPSDDLETRVLLSTWNALRPEMRCAEHTGLGAGTIRAGTVTIPGIAWNDNVSPVCFNLLINRQRPGPRVPQRGSQQPGSAACGECPPGGVASQGRCAIAVRVRADAAEVARVAVNFARTGRQAALSRVGAAQPDVAEAERKPLTASAQLAKLLDLDPSCRLMAVDSCVLTAPLVPLCELLGIAVMPKLAERQTEIL